MSSVVIKERPQGPGKRGTADDPVRREVRHADHESVARRAVRLGKITKDEALARGPLPEQVAVLLGSSVPTAPGAAGVYIKLPRKTW